MSSALAERHAVDHPLLENGAMMQRLEFHALFSDCEDLEYVELIEGVVYLPSPIKLAGHGRQQSITLAWLDHFVGDRVDIEWSSPVSVLLDDDNEPIPDAILFRTGSVRLEDGYLVGAPELILEVANSTRSRDLNQKKRAYERNGVKEYIVWRTRDKAIDWFDLRQGVYVRREPDDRGIIESREFPGLRLDVSAMVALDRRRVLAALRP